MNEKPSGRDAHLAEKKLAVNSTARVRKSRKRLFIFYFYCNHTIALVLALVNREC